MSEKDQILTTFQSVSGETDIEKCLAVLESMDWNLVGALERFMTDQDAEIVAPAEVPDVNADLHSTGDSNIAQSPSKDGQTSPLRAQSPEISADSARASSSFAAEPSSPVLGKKIRLINFEVFYNNQKYPLAMMDEHTVGHMKECLRNCLDVDVTRMKLHFAKRSRVPDSTCIRELHLPKENAITLSVCPLENEGKDGEENEQSSASQASGWSQRKDVKYRLHVKEKFGRGRTHVITENGGTSVRQFRLDVASVTGVPTSKQDWVGWPPYPKINFDMRIEETGIEPVHYFELNRMEDAQLQDIEPADANATANEDFEDSDEEEDAEMYSEEEDAMDDVLDITPAERSGRSQMRPLIPEHIEDETKAVEHFVEVFTDRYSSEGEHLPDFFIGSLESAIKAATNGNCFRRRPLALYLHNDQSVLANIFCSQVLCSQPVADHLNSNNYVLWPWDLTQSLSCARFFTRLTRELGSMAVMQIRATPPDRLPAIIFVNKSRGALEATSIIHGNVSCSEVFSNLLSAHELFLVQLEEEKKAENERMQRQAVRDEQDEAYQDSLRQDQEKERRRQEEEQRMMAELMRSRRAQREVEMEEEAEQRAAGERLPAEPPSDAEAAQVITLRLRLPATAESPAKMVIRRFFGHNCCLNVFDYAHSLGFPISKFKLITTFPRMDLSEEDSLKSLTELGISHQETLTLERR